MKVKHKLSLSLAFLFAVIILLSSTGVYYLSQLATDSAAILKDNNRTLSYMRNIDKAVDQIQSAIISGNNVETELTPYLQTLTENIKLQQENITEPAEQNITDKLEANLNRLTLVLRDTGLDSISRDSYSSNLLPVMQEIKSITDDIYLINEKTMIRKNEQANATADKTVLYMGIVGSASVLIGLMLLFWLPAYISKPLATFNKAIGEIARGNYKQTISGESKDEFGELARSFNTMAAKLDEYEHSSLAKILKEQKRLNALINQLDEVVLGLDESKRVIFANEHCLQLLDLPKNEVINKYAPDIAIKSPLMSNLIQELMMGYSSKGAKNYQPVKIVENNKDKLYSKNVIDVATKPTGEDRRILVGHVVLLTDITDFSEKDKAKTHFIATLSHELKTPVAAIDMSAKLLRNPKSGPLSGNQEELLATIEGNNERIRRMINEVLDVSKIESGTIDVKMGEASAEDLIDNAIDGVHLFLDGKNLKITKNIEGVHSFIKVDAHKTVWVLNNFLTNAIRYAPEGSTIDVKAEMVGSRLKISVTDQGKGIATDDQQKVFLKFNRLSKTETGGTGLGLAISKEFVEAMGGKIGVQSSANHGATFWITFPISKLT
ncbi:ATP-binding protein [Algoriphagus sp. Y33]|uniref:sensor histidine kinase n=1 Tax=Algoriphagus sp. Y33 TaxID=2772483 RepID=UPI001781B2EC|nr:ATP-binding protein [Algoriphagus sp. Y33]